MKKTISILLALGLALVATFAVFADSETINSDTSVMVYGPLNAYAPLGDPAWGNSPVSAVNTWVHPSWPTISGASWISNTYQIEGNISGDTWRLFRKTVELCEGAHDISGTITATSDNAEAVYVNGTLVGSDGEIEGAFVDNQEWGNISDYYYVASANTLTFDFIVRNYAGTNSATGNPTGLIFKATIGYDCNQPPVADPDGPYLSAAGSPISFDGTGSYDTDGDDLTFDWNWGDYSTSTNVGAETSHTYTDAGIYNVCLTVTDPGGLLDTNCTLAVVYDPSAGFVTGGGWIWSPAGAYTADPTLEGKASFGFVAKYKKGANEPDGNTEFQFKAGDLNFHSTSYQWLVVAGDNAKFKGVGTINGSGNYGFMLTANDGSPDTFRIKIWDIDNSDAVIYDNKMTADDNGYDATELGGGSIVIHK